MRGCLAVGHHNLAGGTALHLREGVVHERVRAGLQELHLHEAALGGCQIQRLAVAVTAAVRIHAAA